MGRYENSVGRAYYSIFSAMRALLALKEVDSKSHAGVFALFNQHFVKHKLFPRGFSKMIREAKQVREKADYGDFEHVSKDIAARHIENAEIFLQRVDTVMRQMIVKANGK